MVGSRHRSRRRSVLLILVLSAVTLMTLDLRGNTGVIQSVRDGANDAIAPVQSAVGGVFDPISDWWAGVTESSSLERDNARLRQALTEARTAARRAAPLELENAELRALAELESVADLDRITAEIIARSPGNFGSSVQLNKGSNDGIAVDMPVVSGAGLAGRISSVSARRSTVLLLTDPDSEVGVRFTTNDVLALAKGRTGSDRLTLSILHDPDTATDESEVEIPEGEIVVTAGLDNGVFPAGLPVGRVDSATKLVRELDPRVLVEPYVQVSRLQFLDVLVWPSAGGGSAGGGSAGSGSAGGGSARGGG